LKRRIAIGAAVVLGIPALVVAIFFIGVRHVPFNVPEDQRPPAALLQPNGGLTVRYLGVSGYEVSDGKTVVLLDPTPTRPPPTALLSGPLVPDEAYGAKLCPRADFILVNHTHFDHALDVPAIALRTGAIVVGSPSTVNLALSRGVPAERTRVVKPGDHFTLGSFTVDVRSSRHTDIAGISQPMSGVVAVNAGPLWFWQYTIDETLAFRLEASGTSIWFHPTSTFATGEIGALPAATLIVGVTGEKQTRQKIEGLLAEAKPVRVLPTHYDNFFQPMQKGLAAMPGFDLDSPRRLFLEANPALTWITLDYDAPIHLPPD
jgi:L-ascorbate metabolism protein UlaG (beta-lactamase superfamily)